MENPIQLQVIAASLHNRLHNSAVHIPRLPNLAGNALQLALTSGAQPQELEALLQSEPAIADKVLQSANSGFFGSYRSEDLTQVIEHLGLNMTANLAFCASIHAGLFYAPGYSQCIVEQLRYSLLCAAWAREIAILRRRCIDSAFLSGLLKSIGRPVVIEAALDCAVRHRMHLSYDDLVILADQFESTATERVLSEWNMPETICDVARHWLNYRAAGEVLEPTMTVTAASRLATRLGRTGKQNVTTTALLKEPVFHDLGIHENMLALLLSRAGAVCNFADLLGQ